MTIWQWIKALFKLMPDPEVHYGKASSFADPEDVRRFRECKKKGYSDKYCFRFGDNAIGCWGDKTHMGTGLSCALPPEDIIQKWGSLGKGRKKPVRVTVAGREVICLLKDRMPAKKNINNGAIIDLNPDALKALGLKPPVMINCSWRWG